MMSTRHKLFIVLCSLAGAVPGLCHGDEMASGFVHPGISHNQAEFIASKIKARAQPWHDAREALRSSDSELSV